MQLKKSAKISLSIITVLVMLGLTTTAFSHSERGWFIPFSYEDDLFWRYFFLVIILIFVVIAYFIDDEFQDFFPKPVGFLIFFSIAVVISEGLRFLNVNINRDGVYCVLIILLVFRFLWGYSNFVKAKKLKESIIEIAKFVDDDIIEQ